MLQVCKGHGAVADVDTENGLRTDGRKTKKFHRHFLGRRRPGLWSREPRTDQSTNATTRAEAASDRRVVLDKGRVVLEGPSRERLADEERLRRYLSV